MKKSRIIILTLFTILMVFVLAWNAYLYTLPSADTKLNYYYNLGYGSIFLFGALMSVFYGFRFGLKSNIGKMLVFLGIGLMGEVLGLLIWVYYNEILQVEIPYPSWADFGGFMHMYIFTPIGCFYLLKIYKSLITKNILRDSIIIITVSFLLIFGLFSRPDLSANVEFWGKVFNIYYPVGDVICLALVLIALRIGGGKIHPSLYIFFLGILFQVAADLLYSYRTATEIYWNGDISDLLFTFAGYFMSVGIFEIVYNLNQVSENHQSQSQTTSAVQPALVASSSPQIAQQTTSQNALTPEPPSSGQAQ